MIESISFIDFIIGPLFLLILYLYGVFVKNKHIETNKSYKYFLSGLMVKMAGAIAVCLVYVYYYKGGDTTNYHHDSVVISRLFLKSPIDALKLTFLPYNPSMTTSLDYTTGYLLYTYDMKALFVDRLTWVLNLLSMSSYLGQSMLLAFICYLAMWRLYQVLVYEFPDLTKQMAFAVLFVPSVVFWGSGLLKDTITLACVATITSAIHSAIRLRVKIFKNIFYFIIASFLLITIKPYIFFALLPGAALWFGGIMITNLQNKLLKKAITPLLILVSAGAAYIMLHVIGNSLGEYRVENVLNKAVVTQQDLKQEYYGGSTFDIGDFDPSIRGIIGKAPAAINAALFRPYIWEAHNPAMIMSAMENIVILIFSVYFIWKLRFFNLFRLMFRHHFLFFSLSFSIFFAFSVGLTTSNFGSLVRYKIPAMPFYIASLFIISNTYSELKRKKEEEYAEDSSEKQLSAAY
jgi:hypothetical protein